MAHKNKKKRGSRRQSFGELFSKRKPWTRAELRAIKRHARKAAAWYAELDRQAAEATAEAWALLDELDGGYTG